MRRIDALFRAPLAPRAADPAPRVRRLIRRLRTPEAVQAWLERMPYNWERDGETLSTLPTVLRRGSAHCLEAALAAATILECHGHPPILLDLESVDLLDHVLLLFRRNGRFGTVARSRDPGSTVASRCIARCVSSCAATLRRTSTRRGASKDMACSTSARCGAVTGATLRATCGTSSAL
jgi:hypothetical protein